MYVSELEVSIMYFINLKNKISSLKYNNKIVLFTLSIAHFLDDGLGRGLTTILPLLRTELNLTYFDVSIIGSIRSATNAIGNPLMGWISDRTGKRQLLLILGLLGYYLGTAALGITKNLSGILFVVFIAQLAASIYHPQATSILNYYFNERLHSAIGIHGALGAVGLVVFPIFLSYSIEIFGWRISPMLVYFPFAIIAIILIFIVIKDPDRTESSTFNISLLKNSWRPIFILSMYSGLHTMTYLNSSLFLPLYFESIKGFTIIEIGYWIGISSIGNILGQLLVGFGTEKFGSKNLVFTTSVLYGVFFYLFLNINNKILQLLLLILFSAVNAASFPLVMSITTEIIDKRAVTSTFGIVQSITGITRVIISPLMGYLADTYGLIFSMSVSAIPVVVSGVLIYLIKKKE